MNMSYPDGGGSGAAEDKYVFGAWNSETLQESGSPKKSVGKPIC